jgi:NAD(P)-dependent dehydrogenase (short-subunit alcohol dehydrogenase family)
VKGSPRHDADDLSGRAAVVTGGTKGIGLAIAAELLRAGASVTVASRKSEGVAAAVAQLSEIADLDRVVGVVAHVAAADQAAAAVQRTVDAFGRVDILVNNAATNPYNGPLTGISEAAALKTAQVNQYAPLLWTKLATEAWMSEHGGSIVNVASVGGMIVDPNIGFYNATKAGLLLLTRQLAYELGPRVRVNAIAPGLIKTELARAVWEEREHILSEKLPMRRLGTVEDVAYAVRFLVSDRAAWLTGQTIVLDGGALALPIGVEP